MDSSFHASFSLNLFQWNHFFRNFMFLIYQFIEDKTVHQEN